MAINPSQARQKPQTKNEIDTQTDECVHVWQIDPPAGPESLGHCKLCGGERKFKNSLEISYWDSQRKKANVAKANAESRDSKSTDKS